MTKQTPHMKSRTRKEELEQRNRLGRSVGKQLIMKTCLYNFDPLKPQIYIVKLGFTGIYIFFLFLLKSIDCEFSF